jgi:hypothetical protein
MYVSTTPAACVTDSEHGRACRRSRRARLTLPVALSTAIMISVATLLLLLLGEARASHVPNKNESMSPYNTVL